MLDEAEEAVSRYDWEAVRQAAQAVLAFDPGNGDAQELLDGAERAMSSSATPPTGQATDFLPTLTPIATSHPSSFSDGR